MNGRKLIGIAFALVLASCSETSIPPNEPDLAPLAAVGSTDRVIPGEYIVIFKPTVRDVHGELTRMAPTVDLQADVTWDRAIKGFKAHLSADQLRTLRANPNVAFVEPNRVVHISGTQSPTSSWGIDRIDQANLPLNGTYTYPTSTNPVHIYILDTGLNASHTEFTGRVGAGHSVLAGGTNDCNGHGTHVAGVAAGTIYGVAKSATVHAVRVLDCNGNGAVGDVITGLNWVASNAIYPAVANISFNLGSVSNALDNAVLGLTTLNVPTVVGAGNNNTDACNDSPGRLPIALTVAATGHYVANDNTVPPTPVDERASFSNYGVCVELFAPGTNIQSAWIGGATATQVLDGTSVAAAHVSGVVALIFQKFGQMSYSLMYKEVTINANTPGVVSDPGSQSPNKLLYMGYLNSTCFGTQNPGGTAEGEVFGNFYEGGSRKCGNDSVSLTPYADAQSRLHMPSYRPSLWASSNFVRMFEWWDPGPGGPCTNGTLANYVANGAGMTERSHAPAAPKEGHCVRPGRYAWSGGGRTFDVDYIQPSGNMAFNTATGQSETIEVTAYDPGLNFWQDLVINTDITSIHPGDTPLLDIDNAGSTPYSGTFANHASPSGTKNDWFRFSASRSTSGWNLAGQGTALAKLYFDTGDPANATAFYDHKPGGVGTIRLHRYPNPTTASRVYTVGLDLLRPDELPGSSPSVTRTITINRINPDLAPGTISLPVTAAQGSQFNATIQEKNLLGTADVEAPWIGRLYFSTDQTLQLASDAVGATFTETVVIGPSGTRTVSYLVTVPPALPIGNYYLLARLDTANAVLEANESNNTGASAAQIQVTVPPCRVSPSYVFVPAGGGKQMMSVQTNCDNRELRVTPATGTVAGFNGGSCTVKSKTLAPGTLGFFVWGCTNGSAQLTIYKDATLTIVEQVVQIDVGIQ